MAKSKKLVDWVGDYGEDGDSNEAHIERLYKALDAVIEEASEAAVHRAEVKIMGRKRKVS